jgi:hypothetical protein
MPASVEKCVSNILPSLRDQYPKKSDKALTSMAWAICQSQHNKQQKKKGSTKAMASDDLTLRWDGKMKVFQTLTEAMFGLDHETHRLVELEDVSDILIDESTFVEVDCHSLAGDNSSNYAIPRLKALPYKSSSGPNAACVRNALARFNQVKGATDAEKASAKRKLLSAAKSLGIKTGESEDPDAELLIVENTIASDNTVLTEAYKPGEESPHIFLRGTAIGEGVTRNLNEYLAVELERAAPTLAGVPLQLDHGRTVYDNAGRVLVASYDPRSKSIEYVARLRRSKTDAFEAVLHGDVDSVSIGANINDVLCNVCGESKLKGNCKHVVGREYEGEIATRIGVGLEFFELSVTPFGAYQGANIAGVVSHNSTTLDDAIASFTESWNQKFGEQKHMSEPERDHAAELELVEVQKKLTAAEQAKLKLTEQLNGNLARTIAEAEIEMGQRKSDDLVKRIESLKSKPVEALELLAESTRERLILFRHDNDAVSRSQGIVTEEDDDDGDPTVISAEETKDFLREKWMGWPKPSESAKATIRAFRSNSYNPNVAEYARRQKGGR